MTAARLTNLYDLMDSAYDVPEIKDHSRALGHVPIIDVNPRRSERKRQLADEARRRKRAGYRLAEDVRHNERSTVERVGCQPFRFLDAASGIATVISLQQEMNGRS
ncbi:MAG: hypothetical protein QF511_07380 [Rhodospirillales bacterium]|jgi:hypothetical protein|nr:hypothetical protein [Rhodospirillales bacterium]